MPQIPKSLGNKMIFIDDCKWVFWQLPPEQIHLSSVTPVAVLGSEIEFWTHYFATAQRAEMRPTSMENCYLRKILGNMMTWCSLLKIITKRRTENISKWLRKILKIWFVGLNLSWLLEHPRWFFRTTRLF